MYFFTLLTKEMLHIMYIGDIGVEAIKDNTDSIIYCYLRLTLLHVI